MSHCSAIPGSKAVLIVVLLLLFLLLFWFNLQRHPSCSVLANWSPLSLVKEEMPSLEMKPLATSPKTWGQDEMSMTDSVSVSLSLSHLLSDKIEKKKKKMPSLRNCCTLLFLIFHMKGFYLSTGGSRKAGFLLSKYINTFFLLQLVAWSTAIISGARITQDSENKYIKCFLKSRLRLNAEQTKGRYLLHALPSHVSVYKI